MTNLMEKVARLHNQYEGEDNQTLRDLLKDHVSPSKLNKMKRNDLILTLARK